MRSAMVKKLLVLKCNSLYLALVLPSCGWQGLIIVRRFVNTRQILVRNLKGGNLVFKVWNVFGIEWNQVSISFSIARHDLTPIRRWRRERERERERKYNQEWRKDKGKNKTVNVLFPPVQIFSSPFERNKNNITKWVPSFKLSLLLKSYLQYTQTLQIN